MVHSHPMSPAGFGAPANCEFQSRLGAYLDGELDAAQQAQVESHLAACEDCRTQLDEIRELSRLAQNFEAGEMSLGAVRRIHRAIDADQQFSIFRVATVLSGLAASALVIGAAWMAELPGGGSSIHSPVVVIHQDQLSHWEKVAVNGPLPSADQLHAEATMVRAMTQGLDGKQQ